MKRGKRGREGKRKERKREADRKIDSDGKYTGIPSALARSAGIVSVTFPNQLFTDSLRTIVFHCTTSSLLYFSQIILVKQMRMQYPH